MGNNKYGFWSLEKCNVVFLPKISLGLSIGSSCKKGPHPENLFIFGRVLPPPD